MSYTLANIKNNVKRRIRQLRQTTGSGTTEEDDAGNMFGDSAIADAINSGRKEIMVILKNAELWGEAKGVFQTVLNTQEYVLDDACLKILAVMYDTTSLGVRQASTYECIDVKSRKGEERVTDDPMDQPSTTNPKYYLNNNAIKLLTSTDGTQVADKYMLVEFIRELDDLSDDSDTSDIPDTLNELVILWAIFVLCTHELPNLSAAAKQEFYSQAQIMNQRGY